MKTKKTWVAALLSLTMMIHLFPMMSFAETASLIEATSIGEKLILKMDQPVTAEQISVRMLDADNQELSNVTYSVNGTDIAVTIPDALKNASPRVILNNTYEIVYSQNEVTSDFNTSTDLARWKARLSILGNRPSINPPKADAVSGTAMLMTDNASSTAKTFANGYTASSLSTVTYLGNYADYKDVENSVVEFDYMYPYTQSTGYEDKVAFRVFFRTDPFTATDTKVSTVNWAQVASAQGASAPGAYVFELYGRGKYAQLSKWNGNTIIPPEINVNGNSNIQAISGTQTTMNYTELEVYRYKVAAINIGNNVEVTVQRAKHGSDGTLGTFETLIQYTDTNSPLTKGTFWFSAINNDSTSAEKAYNAHVIDNVSLCTEKSLTIQNVTSIESTTYQAITSLYDLIGTNELFDNMALYNTVTDNLAVIKLIKQSVDGDIQQKYDAIKAEFDKDPEFIQGKTYGSLIKLQYNKPILSLDEVQVTMLDTNGDTVSNIDVSINSSDTRYIDVSIPTQYINTDFRIVINNEIILRAQNIAVFSDFNTTNSLSEWSAMIDATKGRTGTPKSDNSTVSLADTSSTTSTHSTNGFIYYSRGAALYKNNYADYVNCDNSVLEFDFKNPDNTTSNTANYTKNVLRAVFRTDAFVKSDDGTYGYTSSATGAYVLELYAKGAKANLTKWGGTTINFVQTDAKAIPGASTLAENTTMGYTAGDTYRYRIFTENVGDNVKITVQRAKYTNSVFGAYADVLSYTDVKSGINTPLTKGTFWFTSNFTTASATTYNAYMLDNITFAGPTALTQDSAAPIVANTKADIDTLIANLNNNQTIYDNIDLINGINSNIDFVTSIDGSFDAEYLNKFYNAVGFKCLSYEINNKSVQIKMTQPINGDTFNVSIKKYDGTATTCTAQLVGNGRVISIDLSNVVDEDIYNIFIDGATSSSSGVTLGATLLYEATYKKGATELASITGPKPVANAAITETNDGYNVAISVSNGKAENKTGTIYAVLYDNSNNELIDKEELTYNFADASYTNTVTLLKGGKASTRVEVMFLDTDLNDWAKKVIFNAAAAYSDGFSSYGGNTQAYYHTEEKNAFITGFFDGEYIMHETVKFIVKDSSNNTVYVAEISPKDDRNYAYKFKQEASLAGCTLDVSEEGALEKNVAIDITDEVPITTDIRAFDADGGKFDVGVDNSVVVEAVMTNRLGNGKKPRVIVASYNGGTLVNVTVKEVEIAYFERMKTDTVTSAIPSDADDVKVFVWESMNSVKPYKKSVDLKGTDSATVYLLGDSLASNYLLDAIQNPNGLRGWGMYINQYFGDNITIQNLATPGYRTYSYRDYNKGTSWWEYLQTKTLKAGDSVIVALGSNDMGHFIYGKNGKWYYNENVTTTIEGTTFNSQKKQYAYSSSDAGVTTVFDGKDYRVWEMQENLRKFLDDCRRKDVNVILVGLPAVSGDKNAVNYPEELASSAIREIAEEYNATYVDPKQKTVEVVADINNDPTKDIHSYFVSDNVHYTEYGAKVVLDAIMNGINVSGSPLAQAIDETKLATMLPLVETTPGE